MVVLKCKVCGGDIIRVGERTGECQSCGNTYTLPAIDDDKRAELYNRGNHFRQIGEYDEAYSAFEHIIAEDPSDVDAHMQLFLCRYGVKYVRDPKSGLCKPTVSRMSYESVESDQDYQAALKNSDGEARATYKKQADEIRKIQEQYMKISRQEQPYDVFICFKENGEDGERTLASVEAQDIYERLSAKGLRVFFSRITLQDKLGESYEPYIFAALNSAKVMLLVANEKTQIESEWVRNEWSRYMILRRKDKSKNIIPVYFDMDIYDFPQEIAFQGVDLKKPGAFQDLERAVMKICGHIQQNNANSGARITMDNLYKRMSQALEDKDYEETKKLADQILNYDPENGKGYLGRLLGEFHVSQIEELPLDESWISNRYCTRALQYADDNIKNRLQKQVAAAKKETLYQKAKYESINGDYQWALTVCEGELKNYKDSQDIAKDCREHQKYDADCNAYLKELGDSESYLYKKMQEVHPKEIGAYMKLRMKEENQSGGFYHNQEKRIAIIAVISLICAIFNVQYGNGWEVFWIIAAVSVYKRISGVSGAKLTVVSVVVLTVIYECAYPYIPFIKWIMCIASAVFSAAALYNIAAISSKKETHEKRIQYYTQVISPLEQELATKLSNHYAPLIGEENIQALTSINAYLSSGKSSSNETGV